VVVSHDTLCTSAFIGSIRTFECSRLLIADEVHNLGRDGFIKNSPDFIEYRLGLSATPIRQYDPEGTSQLLDYFGEILFRFKLSDAIGKCLVEYDYYVHPVDLTETEMDSWVELTSRIRQNSWRQADGPPDDFLAKLLRDRRAILETAKGKLPMLASLLEKEDARSLKHTLIYASDKAPEQLRSVNALLNRKGILFHQLTAEETADRTRTASIIRAFQNGELQVLTAKRVLDEGVNIPQIRRAFILASTTVGRQWIQRRGRLLRICPEIGKTHSVIHDFVVLPPMSEQALDDDARALVKSELSRLQDFASLARNAGKPDGPLPVIHELVESAMM
jgi:superfamily II DNA or RNA helicase